jgi:hypothetical protein
MEKTNNCVEKWAKHLSWQLRKEDFQMTTKNTKGTR